jgi:hypothetical protein
VSHKLTDTFNRHQQAFSMNTPDTHTETVTRTETVTETVTTAACPVCEQRVDSAELVSVEIGAADDATGCCRYCAEALFGFEGEPDGADTTSDTSIDTSGLYMPHEVAAARVGTLLGRLSAHRQELVSLVVGLATTAVVGLVGMEVATEASAQLASQDVTQVGAPLELMGPVFTTVLIAAVIWLVGKMMVAGPRP